MYKELFQVTRKRHIYLNGKKQAEMNMWLENM